MGTRPIEAPAAPDSSDEKLTARAFEACEAGRYEEALEAFTTLKSRWPDTVELEPYIAFCQTVVNVKPSPGDTIYLLSRKVRPWLQTLKVASLNASIIHAALASAAPIRV